MSNLSYRYVTMKTLSSFMQLGSGRHHLNKTGILHLIAAASRRGPQYLVNVELKAFELWSLHILVAVSNNVELGGCCISASEQSSHLPPCHYMFLLF